MPLSHHVYQNPTPTGTRPRRSYCARAIAKTARSGSGPSATSPIGPRRILRACAASSKAAPSSLRSAKPSPSPVRCRMAMSAQHSARRTGSASTASFARTATACRDLVLAMIVGRILDPASKLAAARALSPATATSSLGTVLGLGEVDEDELYAALDWLLERQPAIETALARRHLKNGTLVLYDVSSSYMEGRCCPIAQRGYSRDGRRGTLQIVYGLLCAPDGCPAELRCSRAPPVPELRHRPGREISSSSSRSITSSWSVIAADHPGASHRRYQGRRARLDHRVARPSDPGVGQGRRLATLAVRPARHGRHHQPRLPR